MNFICLRMKQIPINGFALSLALKWRPRFTQKCPFSGFELESVAWLPFCAIFYLKHSVWKKNDETKQNKMNITVQLSKLLKIISFFPCSTVMSQLKQSREWPGFSKFWARYGKHCNIHLQQWLQSYIHIHQILSSRWPVVWRSAKLLTLVLKLHKIPGKVMFKMKMTHIPSPKKDGVYHLDVLHPISCY